MSYVDLNTIHNPATGTVPPATWGDQVRDNDEFLIDPPACSVFHNTTQSSTNGVGLILAANSENFDNDAMHSTSSNTSRITATTAGRYKVAATIEFAADANGDRRLAFIVNSATTHQSMRVGAGPAGTTTILTGSRDLVLAVSDFVECQATQASGGNLNVTLLEFSAIYLTR